jgi:hypothetical protein
MIGMARPGNAVFDIRVLMSEQCAVNEVLKSIGFKMT